MKRPVNLTLDEDLFLRFRIRAIEEKTSASAIIEKLMGAYLGEAPYPPRGRQNAGGKCAHPKKAKASAG